MLPRLFTLVVLMLMIAACSGGSRDDTPQAQPAINVVVSDKSIANSFLTFLNTQAALAAGDYYIVAATAAGGEADSYSIRVTFDDGTTQNFSGTWTNAGGQDPLSSDNPKHLISLSKAGGIDISLSSSIDNYLYLMRNDQIIAEDDNTGTGSNARIQLANSAIDALSYAEAYYQTIDPNQERTTLNDWKVVNGFDNGEDFHITFRDEIDLGYGRDMYIRTRVDGGIAIYVDNYVVPTEDGDVTSYGPLGLDAAISKDRRFLQTTNAIEYSPVDPNDPNSDKVVKMFNFAKPDSNGTQQLDLLVNLDGRGDKYMPTACMACHGGYMYPLNPDGSFPEASLKSMKFNTMDPGHFGFAEAAGFTEEQMQPLIRDLNQLIHSSYQEMDSRAANDKGKWSSTYAKDWITGAYANDFSADSFDENYVPEGWRQNANRPDGVERLFLEVVKPHCLACHQLRGNEAAESITTSFNNQSVSLANAINFSSYEKFISYNDRIIDLVYRRGQMPLSLLNYTVFWEYPEGAPTLLASFLTDFDVFDTNGNIVEPQKPVAVAGDDRIASSPVLLSGQGSILSSSYSWRIVSSPAGANAQLSSTDSMLTNLMTDRDGDYLVALTTTNESGLSDEDMLTITIDSNLTPTPDQLNFVDDILPILADQCVDCHNDNSRYPSIPAYYNSDYALVYKDVRDRVNFANPSASLLLMKPTQLQHGGGVLLDRTRAADELQYQTLLNWIINGAPCGTDPQICAN